MKFKFRKWIKGTTKEENKRLGEIDREFGYLLEKLETYNVEREAIFIYGMFNFLEYLHLKNNDLLHRLIMLLESYIIFIRMRTNYNDFPYLPSQINIRNLGEEYDINIITAIHHKSDGSSECYSLIKALIKTIKSLKNKKNIFNKDDLKNVTIH